MRPTPDARGPTLELHVDGTLVASGTDPAGRVLDLGELPELTVGRGPRGPFAGSVVDVEVQLGSIQTIAIERRARRAAGDP